MASSKVDKFDETSARDRGLRIKEARNLAGFKSAKEFCQKHPEISLSTLKAWESGKYYTLTPKGAYRICEALKKDGYHVTPDWLLNNDAPQPRECEPDTNMSGPSLSSENFLNELINNYNRSIQIELGKAILSSNHAVYHQVTDNSMAPILIEGDWVFGYWLYGCDILHLLTKTCLVETEEGSLFCRCLTVFQKSHNQAEFKSASNKKTKANIKRAAIIIRIYPGIKRALNPAP